MARCFAGEYAAGNLSTGKVSVSASADQFGGAMEIPTRGRLTGDLWLHGGNAYGISQIKVHSTSIEFKIHTFFGAYIEMSDNSVSMNLPTIDPPSPFPANSKYYLNALGDVAEVALGTLGTLGAVNLLSAGLSVTPQVGIGINLAKTALPMINNTLRNGIIASGIISGAAKFGNQMLTDPPPSGGGIRITPQNRYLICVADLAEENSQIRDASGSDYPKSSGGSPSHSPTYNDSYNTYERTANYENRSYRETGSSPLTGAVDELAENAWGEMQIIIRDSFNQNNVEIKPDNDPSWVDAKNAFKEHFTNPLEDIINRHSQDFNDDRLAIDAIKSNSELINELKDLKRVQEDIKDKEAGTDSATGINWNDLIKVLNRYFLKMTTNLQVKLLDGETKEDLIENNPNIALTNEFFYRSLDQSLQDSSNTEGTV